MVVRRPRRASTASDSGFMTSSFPFDGLLQAQAPTVKARLDRAHGATEYAREVLDAQTLDVLEPDDGCEAPGQRIERAPHVVEPVVLRVLGEDGLLVDRLGRARTLAALPVARHVRGDAQEPVAEGDAAEAQARERLERAHEGLRGEV